MSKNAQDRVVWCCRWSMLFPELKDEEENTLKVFSDITHLYQLDP